MVYVYLQQYLLKVAAQPSFATWPAVFRVPLSQPDFLLGVIFVFFILFAPGGLDGALTEGPRVTTPCRRHRHLGPSPGWAFVKIESTDVLDRGPGPGVGVEG